MKELLVDNIDKNFEEKKVFDKFKIYFDSQKINLISGTSGIGKTTLLRIISNLDKSDNESFSIKYYEKGILKDKYEISMLFQEDRLIENLSAYRNILFALGKFKMNAVEKSKMNYLFSILNMEDELNNKVENFSGGMKRRLAIIRTLMKEADIYIFDEIFKGLDQKLKEITLDLIIKETKDKICIIVSHDSFILEKCNKLNNNLSDNLNRNLNYDSNNSLNKNFNNEKLNSSEKTNFRLIEINTQK